MSTALNAGVLETPANTAATRLAEAKLVVDGRVWPLADTALRDTFDDTVALLSKKFGDPKVVPHLDQADPVSPANSSPSPGQPQSDR